MCVLCTLIARSSSEGGQWWPSPMREAQWSNPQDSPTLSPHGGWLVLLCAHDIAYLHSQSLPFAWVSHKKRTSIFVFPARPYLDNRQGTSSQHQYCYLDLVIWYCLSFDTICQLNQFNTNSKAAMLSTWQCCRQFWPPGIRHNRGLIWSPLFWIWGAFVIIRSTILLLWIEKQLWLPGE